MARALPKYTDLKVCLKLLLVEGCFFFLVSDFCGGNLLNLLIFWEFSEAYVFLWLVDY